MLKMSFNRRYDFFSEVTLQGLNERPCKNERLILYSPRRVVMQFCTLAMKNTASNGKSILQFSG